MGTPASENPTKASAEQVQAGTMSPTNAATDTTTNNADSSALFNDQMYLMDYFASKSNTAMFTKKSGSPNVLDVSWMGIVNDIITQEKGVFRFLQNVKLAPAPLCMGRSPVRRFIIRLFAE